MDSDENTGVYGIFIASDRDAIVQKGRRRRSDDPDDDYSEEVSEASTLSDPLGRPHENASYKLGRAERKQRRGATKNSAKLRMSESMNKIATLAKEANFHMMSIAQLARTPPNIKQLVFLDKLEKASKVPPAAPEDVLAQGGHVILAVAGGASAAREGESGKIGLEHFVSPMRAAYFAEAIPIVVLAPFIPMDWNTVARFPEVYFVQGSALSLFDLERANFRQAATILVSQLGSTKPSGSAQDPYMVDAEAIFTVRLIENHLPKGSETVVVVELVFDENYHYLPHSANLRISGFLRKSMNAIRRSTRYAQAAKGDPAPEPSTDATPTVVLPIRQAKFAQPEEYFRQPRFACGQLYVGSVVTSLVANTFYNPSLAQLVQQMISSRILMVILPTAWAGRSYLDLFQHLILDRNLLAIGLFRTAEPASPPTLNDGCDLRFVLLVLELPLPGRRRGPTRPAVKVLLRRHSYVYTAPTAMTLLVETDQILCVCVPTSDDAEIEDLFETDEAALDMVI
ncbi:Calcium-activated potassium channel subunit alpha-1 [Perkinsus olseni]|uniref:Calcium-activated potassium channel subunit alpha-1 n=1 Tax=Perkinsus olseni TaxID=32597 RepID=A0A7J6TB31_PEROL|nr:Calcium-activated potassium channel subunit alpha-1 [Perkinsus olseni]